MNKFPDELKYTENHLWVYVLGEGQIRVGITDYAQQELGDLVYVELPEPGATFTAESECAVVESVKSASDIYCPISGEIIEVNEALNDQPELVNSDPYGEGWIFIIDPVDEGEIAELMDAEGYEAFISEE